MKTFQGVTRQGNQSEIMHSRGFTCLCVKIYNEKSPSYHFALIIQLSFHRKPCVVISFSFFFFKVLFIFRGEGKEKGRETSMSGCLSCAPYWGPGLQLRRVPWVGIEPATFGFADRRSIYWVTPARAHFVFIFICWLLIKLNIYFCIY